MKWDRDKIEDGVAEVIAEIVVNSLKWLEDLWKSSLTILVIGLLTYFLWSPVLGGLLPEIGFFQALGIAFIARLLCGNPAIHYEAPLDAQERALLLRHQAEDDERHLRAVADMDED
jgi:hypothetical protein